jgi:predicted HicB family RNase H-like nuclease
MAKKIKEKSGEPPERGRINVRLSPEFHEKLIGLAKADGRSLSNYVKMLLEKHATQKSR